MYKKQILVIENNELDRSMLREILQDEYDIWETENGQEAIHFLQRKKEKITLILLDIIMPKMNGYDFLDWIKSEPEFSSIPVIVMTQIGSEADEISALKHGANDYIPKPYRAEVIQHRVASLIKLRETASIIHQVQLDSLTGLYTKEFFYRKAAECLEQYPEKEFTIFCCNLENFKLYNDTYGRVAGDRLLIESAKILQKRVSEDAICCRYNADRFLCLLEKNSERKGRECFVNARKRNRSELSENIAVKIGIYEIIDRTIPVEQMCDRALWVVDTIKGIYDQHIAVYDDTLRSQLLREKAITDVMENALKDEQFVVYFQPKYSLHDEKIIGAEALVRWIHPEWGFMTPGEFIPLFEKNGFISRLDEYVWEQTCRKLREWIKKGYEVVPVSVNVSRADVYHAHIVEHFCNLINTYKIEPSYLHLEITESAYTKNPEQIINKIHELRKHGFVIEMDDFGSGYSSLNMLGRMSIDILKLDMGFVRSELVKPIEQSILNDIINMAHRMHLNVVAEGVETREQSRWLRELGCDCAQGYFYAKPLPEAEFEEVLKKNKLLHEVSAYKTSSVTDLGGVKKRILVIEDDGTYRKIISEILAGQYIVLTASNGKEGLDILQKNGRYISAILLDIQMPVMNGYEFLENFRKNDAFTQIPVIVTTSMDSTDEEDKFIKLGASDFIEKPYSARKLIARLENIIRLKEYKSLIYDMETDVLTGFKKRKAYFNDIMMIEHAPEQSNKPVGIIFADINGLKMTNDKDGHEAGDRLIIEVAKAIKEVFSGAYIYRVGGDEFVLFAFEENEKAFYEKVKRLENSWKDGQSAAIGSVWLERATNLEQNVGLADQAMYRNKSRYYEERNHAYRKNHKCLTADLFRKMDEISEYLPGGFFIFKADAKEEIITFNSEILSLFGCENEEEFRTLTGNSFKGMVHPDDLEMTERTIRTQSKKINDIDFVEYRILCKDGTTKQVQDYGRFVHTELYGDVYYVFMEESMRTGQKTAENKCISKYKY